MITIVIAIAGATAAGAWLRWAVVPVRIAYTVGRRTERLCARYRAIAARDPAHPYAPPIGLVASGPAGEDTVPPACLPRQRTEGA